MGVLSRVTEKFHLYMGNCVYRCEGYCQQEQETPAATKQGILAWLQTSLVTLSPHEAGVAESNHNSKSSV